MAKTWSTDNPKAALMERKRALIVDAAMKAFLNAGYAEASVNHIAADAGVSIKTLYRHFDSKDDLFSAVMQAACGTAADESGDAGGAPLPVWYDAPPEEAFARAGEDYLSHVLSEEQLALYRVVVRDAHRFPELGRRYQEVTAATRDATFAGYLDRWEQREDWTIGDKRRAAQGFAGLLKAGIFDAAVLGLTMPSEREMRKQAQQASQNLLLLLRSGEL